MFATVDIDVGAPQQLDDAAADGDHLQPLRQHRLLVEHKGKDADGKPQLVARQTFVTTGATRGDQVAIAQGREGGDTVVTGGQIKLRNGSPVDQQHGRSRPTMPTRSRTPSPVEGHASR